MGDSTQDDEAQPGQLTCPNAACSRFNRRERGYICRVCAKHTKPRPPLNLYEALGYSTPPEQPAAKAAPQRSHEGRQPRPDRLRLKAGAWTTVLAIASIIALWLLAGPAVAVALLVLSPLWIANVFLGGGLNDTPLNAFGRISRFRASPEAFLTGRTKRRP